MIKPKTIEMISCFIFFFFIYSLTGCTYTLSAFEKEYPDPFLTRYEHAVLTQENNLLLQFEVVEKKNYKSQTWCATLPFETIQMYSKTISERFPRNSPNRIKAYNDIPYVESSNFKIDETNCPSIALLNGTRVPFYHDFLKYQGLEPFSNNAMRISYSNDSDVEELIFIFKDSNRTNVFYITKLQHPISRKRVYSKAKIISIPGLILVDIITFPFYLFVYFLGPW